MVMSSVSLFESARILVKSWQNTCQLKQMASDICSGGKIVYPQGTLWYHWGVKPITCEQISNQFDRSLSTTAKIASLVGLKVLRGALIGFGIYLIAKEVISLVRKDFKLDEDSVLACLRMGYCDPDDYKTWAFKGLENSYIMCSFYGDVPIQDPSVKEVFERIRAKGAPYLDNIKSLHFKINSSECNEMGTSYRKWLPLCTSLRRLHISWDDSSSAFDFNSFSSNFISLISSGGLKNLQMLTLTGVDDESKSRVIAMINQHKHRLPMLSKVQFIGYTEESVKQKIESSLQDSLKVSFDEIINTVFPSTKKQAIKLLSGNPDIAVEGVAPLVLQAYDRAYLLRADLDPEQIPKKKWFYAQFLKTHPDKLSELSQEEKDAIALHYDYLHEAYKWFYDKERANARESEKMDLNDSSLSSLKSSSPLVLGLVDDDDGAAEKTENPTLVKIITLAGERRSLLYPDGSVIKPLPFSRHKLQQQIPSSSDR